MPGAKTTYVPAPYRSSPSITSPNVVADRDVLYVDRGDPATGAESGAGVDLCLHPVGIDHSAGHAARVRSRAAWCCRPHREGGRPDYAVRPLPVRTDETPAPLMDGATEHPGVPRRLR
ncbi:hypothetical protein [Embleya sp. NPDC050493]|uniref:hypothetical protein n=1 Tax=Embleya sp. NPDC050493 TaxID=3363989 RepID=UPI00379FF6B9